MNIPTVTLHDGMKMSRLGLGVFRVPPEETAHVVFQALETSYRSIDTAAIYGNEEGVGEGIKRSGLSRGDAFVTTKVWNTDQGRGAAIEASRPAWNASASTISIST